MYRGDFSMLARNFRLALILVSGVAVLGCVRANAQSLPSGWSDGDIGTVGVTGSASYANNVFTVQGAGNSVGGTADGFHFVYQSLSGDGTIVARVVSLQGAWASQAGVMIRETLSAGSTNAFTSVKYLSTNYAYFTDRATTGGSTSNPGSTGASLPYWVKVVRSGSTFSGYMSSDGVNWVQVGTSQTINMATSVYVGLGVSNNSTASLATATFDNVSVSSTSTPGPVITGLSATTGPVGTQVVISGSGFGATQGNSLALLNGAPMTVSTWTDSSITITIATGATTGPMVVSLAPSMNDSNPIVFTITSQPLPTGWLDTDVGAVGKAGSATYASNVFTVQGGGSSFLSGTADAFHFVYQPLSGDGTIVARLVSISTNYAQSGVEIRETLDAGAKSMGVIAYNGYPYTAYRTTTGGSSTHTSGGGATLPYWVKLVRSGSTFTGYMSSDGVNWAQVGTSQTINMATSVYVGFGVSYSTSTLATATFDNVSVSPPTVPGPVITGLSATTGSVGSQVVISGSGFGATQGSSLVYLSSAAMTVNSWSDTSITITLAAGAATGPLVVSVVPSMNDSNPIVFTITSQPLPTGWLDDDMGVVGKAGSASYSNGVFTVKGAGSTFLSGTADGFHFVYQPLSGDGTIVARVVSVSTNYAQAGVVIRETLDAGARSTEVLAYNGFPYIAYRTITGGSSAYTAGGAMTLPYWVKLVRNGDNFTGYTSADGVNWVQIAPIQTVNLGQSVYVGLGVSYSTSTLATATFDNVSVSTPTAPGPVITGLSATTGPVGSQVVITGSGFGATQGSSLVLLNDTAMTVNSWSDTSINITIATGASSGDMVVSVAPSMNDSNPVVFTITSQPLPSGWLDQDVGTVGLVGSSSYSNGVFTVKGAGTGIGTTSDSFHFAYQPLTTDGTIVARVVSLQGNTSALMAGLFVRETLDSYSAEATTYFYGYSPFSSYLKSRTIAGGAATQSSGASKALPYWVKVVRSTNTFSGYISPDGTNWTQIGSTQTIATTQGVFVGMGVSSGATTVLATATFDNVSITLGGSLANPVVTSLSPSTGAPGTPVTVSGSGFGATQGSSSVTFNGATAAVTSWSDTQIAVVVPDGATSGPVNAIVGNITGVGPTFTVKLTAQLTDSLGNASTYISSVFGGQWAYTDSDGSGCSSCSTRGTIHNQYDSNGNLLWTTDALGNTVSYKYDSSNNQISQFAPVDSNTIATTSYTYNTLGEVLTVTDPLNHVTTNAYDSKGNLTSVTQPVPGTGASASVTQFAYDSKGELTQITDPLGHITTIAYNAVGLISSITDAQNNVTSYQYDAHGNRTSVTDALNHQTTFAYDAGDRLTTITYPDSTTTTFTYDSRGRRTSVTDQNGKTTAYAYDDADRLITVTDAANNVTTYGYDTENNLTSITDANGNATAFAYDAYGRVTRTTFPSTAVEDYAYDADNNLTSKTDRKGQTIQYVYDALNRLTRKIYPDSTEADYTYDLVSKILQVNDPTGTYAFAYDSMGRLIGTTTSYSFLTGRNFTTSYIYDKASNRTGFTDPESGSTTYAYDTLNRPTTLTPPSAFTSGSFGFSYDALSRRTSLTRPNNVTTSYTYDNLSRLLSVLHQLSGSTIDGATYTVDNAGNRTAKTDWQAGVTSNYSYDAIYELSSVLQGANTTESYSYDPVGNRLSSLGLSPYSYNSSNELTSTPNATYGYDLDGNAVTKNDSTGITTYAWDFENRLTSVTLPGTGGTVSFTYDPFGRRVKKVSSAGTSIYAYDGDNLIEEVNSSGAVVARYSQGLNIDEPLAMLRTGATSFYNADGLGTITSLTNTSGALAQTYTFDSFGKQTASSGSLTNVNAGAKIDRVTP
jgi:YD repeat-containing protein